VRVCMFVKNSFEYDARVTKEARSLVEGSHEVTVVAIHVPGVTAERETTPDGIGVVRVHRLSFGMRKVPQAHARFVDDTEERRARLTGEQVDEARIRRYSTLLPASTATPGENRAIAPPDLASPAGAGSAETPPPRSPPPGGGGGSRLGRIRARLSTAARTGLSQTVRYGFRAAKFVVQGPLKAVRGRALDRRFLEAGLATGAQVWHCHDLNTLAIGVRAKRARPGTRLVYDSHELATERSRMTRWGRWRAGRQERRGLPHTDERIWTTRTRAEYIVRRYGIPFPTLIHNVPERMEVKQGWDLRERLGIPADRRILLYQGSIQEFRGVEESIDAVTLLERCVLVVIGYGYHRPALEEMVRRRGLQDRVYFFGPIPNDELLYYTASADVGLCVIRGQSLSYRWSMPNKLFEYMMAGIPIVASDFEEMGRVVREEGVGTVCDPDDPQSIAAAVRAIVDDPAAEAHFRAATRVAIGKYNWDEEEKKLLALYRRLEPAAG
jgi:glycosyltransferase involved in cell wall biosynthesis